MNVNTQSLEVQIVRYVDDSFPGWVECRFSGAAGRIHTLVDQYPTLTEEMLDESSQYPLPGTLHCEVLSRHSDSRGCELASIGTPGVESTEGLSEFVVLAAQLSPPGTPEPT
jgi:hypothetical protein